MLFIQLLTPMLNICVALFLPAYPGPVLLDFLGGTVSPQVANNFGGATYLNNTNGKRLIDVPLELIADQNVLLKRRRRPLPIRMFCSCYCLKLMCVFALLLYVSCYCSQNY